MTSLEDLHEMHRLTAAINQKLDEMSRKLSRLVVAVEMVAESFDALPDPEDVAGRIEAVSRASHGAERDGANEAS